MTTKQLNKNSNLDSNLSFKAPIKIIINNITFSLKDNLAKEKYSYRCFSRKNCNSIIHILKSEFFN